MYIIYTYKYYIHRNDFNGNSCSCGTCVSCHEDTYIAYILGILFSCFYDFNCYALFAAVR